MSDHPSPGVGPALSALIELAKSLKVQHSTCDDCWYSCPMSGECCDESKSGCDCIAEQHNARVDALIAALSGSVGGLNAAPPWQPIETAPPDTDEENSHFIAAWRDGTHDDVGEVEHEAGGFFCCSTGQRVYPTYWMPLPASPVCAAEKTLEKEKI